MNIRPTEGNGRVLQGETAWGSYMVEFAPEADEADLQLVDEGGRVLGRARIEFATPPEPVKPASKCSGCGGAKYDPKAYNAPGGADQLVQELG